MTEQELQEKFGFVPHPLVLRYAEERGMQPQWIDAVVHDAIIGICQLEKLVASTTDDQSPEGLKAALDGLVDHYASGFDDCGHIDENMPGPGHGLDPVNDIYMDWEDVEL